MKRHFTLSAAVFALVTACGGGRPEPSDPSDGPSGATRQEPDVLTPVNAPADVFAVVRASAPERLVDAGMKWGGLPFDWKVLLTKEVPGVDAVVDFEAPVDLVAMIDPSSGIEPHVLFAVSVGVSSVEGTLTFFQERGEVVKRSERVVQLGPDLTCSVERALGQAPARLVCSDDGDAVRALAPYMTRGLPMESLSDADLHARVLAEPWRRRYGAQAALLRTAGVPLALKRIALDHPRFDGALRDVLYGAADEVLALFDDLESVTLDLTLAPDERHLQSTFALNLRGARSFTAAAIATSAARIDTPPESLWTLPSEVTSAAFAHSWGDVASYRPVVDALAALANGALDYLGVGERQRRPLVDGLSAALLMDQAVVSGHLLASPRTGRGDAPEAVDLAAALREEVGHELLIIEGPVDPYLDFLSALRGVSGDPRVRGRVEELVGIPKGALPTLRERGPKGATGLPRRTRVFEFALPAQLLGDTEGPSVPFVLVLVPGTERSYVGLSADEEELLAHLEALQKGEPRLGLRAGLATVRKGHALAGGFVTLLGILAEVDSPLADVARSSSRGGAPVRGLSRRAGVILPHRGETPVAWRIVPQAEGPRLTLSFEVPRAVVEDVTALMGSGLVGSFLP
jgi:hypothetical protein